MAQSGLPIYVTELDLKGKSTTEASQLASYKSSFPVYWNHPAVAGITLWGYVEGSTWSAGAGILNRDGSERSAMVWLKSFMADQPHVGYPFKGLVDTLDSEGNLIINGEFDNDTYAWQIDNYSGGNGTMTDVSDANMSGKNALKICPSLSGTEPYHVQVSQNAPFELGKRYEISFMAKADAPRNMVVCMQEAGSPYTQYLEEEVSLSATNQSFSIPFHPTTSDPSNKLKFFVGSETSCTYIDSVWYKVVDNTGIDQPGALQFVSVYPNPVVSGKVTVENRYAEKLNTIEVFNLQGKLLETIHTENSKAELDLSHLTKGIYFLRIFTEKSLVSEKIVIL